jgi:predicted nucleic acid-binding protein
VITYVLDSSAVIRYLQGHPGAVRVRDVLQLRRSHGCQVEISAVQWGEVAYTSAKIYGESTVIAVLSELVAFGIEVVAASGDRAVKAGMIKESLKIPYADSFAIELAAGSSDRVLVTADFDMKPAAHLVNIEFLPTK